MKDIKKQFINDYRKLRKKISDIRESYNTVRNY